MYWFLFVACFVVGAMIGVGLSLAHGDGPGPALPILGGALGMAAFGLGLSGYLGRRGWQDEEHLREWLRTTLSC